MANNKHKTQEEIQEFNTAVNVATMAYNISHPDWSSKARSFNYAFAGVPLISLKNITCDHVDYKMTEEDEDGNSDEIEVFCTKPATYGLYSFRLYDMKKAENFDLEGQYCKMHFMRLIKEY